MEQPALSSRTLDNIDFQQHWLFYNIEIVYFDLISRFLSFHPLREQIQHEPVKLFPTFLKHRVQLEFLYVTVVQYNCKVPFFRSAAVFLQLFSYFRS